MTPRLHHTAKFPKRRHLQVLGKNTEQERRNRCIEVAVREIEPGHIHLLQRDRRPECLPSLLCPRQHGGAEINPDNLRPGRVEWDVAASSYASIENPAGKPLKQIGSNAPIPAMLERQVQQVVKGAIRC